MPIALFMLGFVAGIASGMFGIGGGVIIVPVLVTALGFALQQATGTSLAALLMPVGIFAVIEYRRAGKLDLFAAAWIAAGLAMGAIGGANIAINLPSDTLREIYGVFLLYASWRFVEPQLWLAEARSKTDSAPSRIPHQLSRRTMNRRSVEFSAADFVALLCAIAVGVAFLVMPWLSVFGASMTGVKLLSDAQAVVQNDVSVLWLIPLAAVVGGLVALWGLLDMSAQRITGAVACLAGIVGLIYYGLFFVQNSQSLIDATGLVGAGFWVALFASIALVLQVFIPRPVSSVIIPTGQVSSYWLALLGLVAGVASGLFGIGGGVVIVPALVGFLRFDQKTAAGTSLAALLLPVSLGGVLVYYQSGQLDLGVAALIALGLVVGAFAGARIALRLPSKTVKRAYGIFLFFVGLYFIFRDVLFLAATQ